MKVLVGSKNASKVEAAGNAFRRFFGNVEAKGIEVDSKVGNQPVSLKAIVRGASNRARVAWKKEKCDFSVGIESGVFRVPGAKTGYLDVGAVAIFDGKRIHLGFTPAFEYPNAVVKKILNEQKEASDIFQELWNEYPKDESGIIGRLTKGNVPRRLFNEMGLMMALTAIVNKKYYE